MQFIVPLGGWGTDFHNMPEDQKHSLANYFLLWGFFDANILKRDTSFEGIRRSVEKYSSERVDYLFEKNEWIQKSFTLYREIYFSFSERKKYEDLKLAIIGKSLDITKFVFETFVHHDPSPIDQIITLTLIVSELAWYLTRIDMSQDRVAGLYLEDAITVLKNLYDLLIPTIAQ